MCECACLAAFACTHVCMSECLSNFYGDCLVKKRTGALGQPALLSTGSPTGSPRATTYQENRADAHLLDDHFKSACPAGLVHELQAGLDIYHMCTSTETLKKVTIRP